MGVAQVSRVPFGRHHARPGRLSLGRVPKPPDDFLKGLLGFHTGDRSKIPMGHFQNAVGGKQTCTAREA